MDDADGLPLSSPLPLSPPAVQALIDNQDAPPSSESTGGDVDVDMGESDKYTHAYRVRMGICGSEMWQPSISSDSNSDSNIAFSRLYR